MIGFVSNAVWRVLTLVTISVGIFFISDAIVLSLVVIAHIAWWFAAKQQPRLLLRKARKILLLSLVLITAYASFAGDPTQDTWQSFRYWPWQINMYGLTHGIVMVLRIWIIVLASHLVRVGNPQAIAKGLSSFGIPQSAAIALDTTLALLGSDRRGGGGQGRGGGRGRGDGKGNREVRPLRKRIRSFFRAVQRIAKGDVSILADKMDHYIESVENTIEQTQDEQSLAADKRKDVAIVSAIALTMVSIKFLKLLPGLPFAPGHKGVLFIPLYISAGFLTRSRWGATTAGFVLGITSFLLGDGRWGVFEIAKHVVPGLIVDALLPILRKSRTSPVWIWAIWGGLIAVGRFATVTVIALLLEPPSIVYAILVPGLLVHCMFGAISGVVTKPLLDAVEKKRDDR